MAVRLVTIHRLNQDARDEVIGTIKHDGTDYQLNPESSRTLQSILDEPYFANIGGKMTKVNKSDPEAFLENLYLCYKSAYLRASKAESV